MDGLIDRLIAAALTALLLEVCAPQFAVAQADLEAVYCLDEAAGTVQKTIARDCSGKIVSEAEAATEQERRRNYIQGVLSNSSRPQVEGMSLTGLGSGFFVAPDGSVVTNHHVVEGCTAVSITPAFGEMKLVTSVSADAATDLALLRTDVVPPRVAGIVSGEVPLITGQVFTFGYPSNGLATIVPSLSPVEIVGRHGHSPFGGTIVVRGDIRRGNSGGPLLDASGNVIGVVFAKVNSVNVYRATGRVVRNVGYAVPGAAVEALLKDQGIDYTLSQHRAPKSVERMFEYARLFLVQVGCWK